MKLNRIISLLALGAGLFAAFSCEPDEETSDPGKVGELLKKAEALHANQYSLQKKGGEAQVYSLTQEESQWYIGRSYMDRTTPALKVNLMEEDPELSTVAWGVFELPTETIGKTTTLDEEFARKYSWSSGKFGTFRSGKELFAHVGEGGNVVSSSRPQLKIVETKAYSGRYQFVFACVFVEEIYDPDTQTYSQGDEYELLVNAIVEPYTPTLENFNVLPEKDWVKVGGSVKVTVDWTDGAEFDVSKVTLVGAEIGYSSSKPVDNGYFRWDASAQTLTSLKSSNNQDVYLTFRYGDTEMGTTCQIATGPGWDYTSFSFNPSRLVMDKWDAMYLSVDKYAPTNLVWDWDCLEVDPSTNPDEAFWFDKSSHKLYNFSAKPNQTYNLRLQVKSNPNVGASLEVYVVEEKPYSFKITYQQNGTYKPWENGSPDGICNYGMGLSLGVQTNPEDCYWNWTDVELIPGYDNTFSFSGVGGRDDHPKLMLKKSHDGTSYGVQVGFRLKYDHSKTSYIYVTHN